MVRGRRPGGSDTRRAVLDAARRRFAEVGYARSTIRSIAAEAGVDPALVMHFFGSKEDLFRAVVEWPFDPEILLDQLVDIGRDEFAARLTRGFLTLWESTDSGPRLRAVFRSAVTEDVAAGLIREFLAEVIYARISTLIEKEGAELRIDLALGTLLGVAVVRHILQVDPLATVPLDDLVDQLSPSVDRTLFGGFS